MSPPRAGSAVHPARCPGLGSLVLAALSISWTASCGVGGNGAEQALEASFRTATARALTATAAAVMPTPSPATASPHPTTAGAATATPGPPPPRPTPTTTVPLPLLAGARVAAVVARILTTVGAQPIQVIGFPAGIDRARRLAGGAGSSPMTSTPGEPCATDSCGFEGTVVERVQAGCPLGGSLCSVCVATASGTLLTQEHQACKSVGVTTVGGISLDLPERGLCTGGAPLPARLAMRFCDFLGTNGDGEVVKNFDAQLVAAERTGECAFDEVAALLNGRVSVRGFRDDVDQEFVFDETSLNVAVTRFLSTRTCAPADYLMEISGPVVLVDRSAVTQVQTRFDRAAASWFRVGGRTEIGIDGSVILDCLGAVAIETVAPLAAAADATCPDAGELRLDVGGQIVTARFAPESRLLVSLADGSAAAEFGSCVESRLSSTCAD